MILFHDKDNWKLESIKMTHILPVGYPCGNLFTSSEQ